MTKAASMIRSVQAALALKKEKKCLYGDAEGYPVYLRILKTGETIVSITVLYPVSEKPIVLLSEVLDSKMDFRFSGAKFTDEGLDVIFPAKCGADRIISFIQWIPESLRRTGALEAGTCSHCRQPVSGDKALVLKEHDGICRLVAIHPDCLSGYKLLYEKKASPPKDEGAGHLPSRHYVRGFFGALAGALAGLAVWVGVAQLGYFAAICGVAIGFLAAMGYRTFGGRTGPMRFIIIFFIAALGVFGSIAVNFAINMLKNNHEVSAFLSVWNLALRDAGIRQQTLIYLSAGFSFAIIPGLFLFRKKPAGDTSFASIKVLTTST